MFTQVCEEFTMRRSNTKHKALLLEAHRSEATLEE